MEDGKVRTPFPYLPRGVRCRHLFNGLSTRDEYPLIEESVFIGRLKSVGKKDERSDETSVR